MKVERYLKMLCCQFEDEEGGHEPRHAKDTAGKGKQMDSLLWT